MFVTPLDSRYARGGFSILLRPLIWQDPAGDIIVPKGFVTDFASVPASLQSLLKKDGNSKRAAVLHDYLYQRQFMPRLAADKLFKRALKAERVRGAHLFYAGVRLGGGKTWNRYAIERAIGKPQGVQQ